MPARATLNGTITATGGENADQRGFEWGTQSGNYPNSWTENGSFGTGSFNHIIENLELNKTYYFRAKAHNSAGWGYGSEKSFVTPSAVTYHFLAPMVRALRRPETEGKITRSGTVVTLRHSYRKFETQPKLKGSETL